MVLPSWKNSKIPQRHVCIGFRRMLPGRGFPTVSHIPMAFCCINTPLLLSNKEASILMRGFRTIRGRTEQYTEGEGTTNNTGAAILITALLFFLQFPSGVPIQGRTSASLQASENLSMYIHMYSGAPASTFHSNFYPP